MTGIALVTQSRIRKGAARLAAVASRDRRRAEGPQRLRRIQPRPRRAPFRTDFHEKIAEWFLAAGQDGIELDGLAPEEWKPSPFLPSMELRTQASKFFRLTRARAAGTDVLVAARPQHPPGTFAGSSATTDAIETTWADRRPTAAHAIVDELIELHQARWNALGKPGSFSSPSSPPSSGTS